MPWLPGRALPTRRLQVTRIRIRPRPRQGPFPESDVLWGLRDDEKHYWAEAIAYEGRFYYRAKGVTLAISESQHDAVCGNAYLYYFSTALRLHYEILRTPAPGVAPPWGDWPWFGDYARSEAGYGRYLDDWIARRRGTPGIGRMPPAAVELHRAVLTLARVKGWRDAGR